MSVRERGCRKGEREREVEGGEREGGGRERDNIDPCNIR